MQTKVYVKGIVMNIDVKKSGGYCEVVVEGIIKSISDSQAIKDAIGSCSDAIDIQIEIVDSFSITSSVIGFLLKKKQGDGANIQIKVHDSRIFELFESLNLIEVLNIRKV
jgi:hypothetical protein